VNSPTYRQPIFLEATASIFEYTFEYRTRLIRKKLARSLARGDDFGGPKSLLTIADSSAELSSPIDKEGKEGNRSGDDFQGRKAPHR
jgi:hypothetical protein